MDTKKHKDRPFFIAGTTISLIGMVVTPIYLIDFTNHAISSPEAAGFFAFMAFLFVLKAPFKRVTKATLFISLGVVFTALANIILPYVSVVEVIHINIDFDPNIQTDITDSQVKNAIEQLQLWSFVILMICGGAGGSLLGIEADEHSSNEEKEAPEYIVINNTRKIEYFTLELRKMRITFSVVFGLMFLLLIYLLISFTKV